MCVFHENGDAVRLADLVYSPRACLWEHHVYCAVSSTSMECNICHGCHSQWRCHFWSLPAEEPSAEQRLFSADTPGAKLKTSCPVLLSHKMRAVSVGQGFRNCWQLTVALNICWFVGPYLSTIVIRSRLVNHCRSDISYKRTSATVCISILYHCSGSKLNPSISHLKSLYFILTKKTKK